MTLAVEIETINLTSGITIQYLFIEHI